MDKYYVINWDDGSTNEFDMKKEAEKYLNETSLDLPEEDFEVIRGQQLPYRRSRTEIIE